MRILLIPLKEHFQPKKQPFKYPHHNDDYGVEQDFLSYLFNNSNLITQNAKEADWHYLPVFWTRWHLNHDYGKDGIAELQDEVNNVLIDDRKTFTICQYDDGPMVNIGDTKLFLASRKSDAGYDIPLLSSAHRIPASVPSKKYLASFAGRLDTYPLRQKMADTLQSKDIYIYGGNRGPKFFVDLLLSSYIALCPRGYGGSSFRFYEAMQAGTVPFLISDIDTRPFKDFIDWDSCSLFTGDVSEIKQIIKMTKKEILLEMGKRAATLWEQELTYQKWCKYVVKTLESPGIEDKHSRMAGNGRVSEHCLSYIIPCYNCSETIADAIESIYQQELDIPFEVVCTDDCSTDKTKELLFSYQEKYSNFHVHFHEHNKGGAAARNTCVKHSAGDLIFCLDSDNILAPNTINRLIGFLTEKGYDAACFAELRYFRGMVPNHSHSWFFEAPNNICDINHIISTHITPASSGNYLYTRESYDRAVGYPEGSGAMDAWGFGFRQHATGTSIAVLPDSFYWHRLSDNSYWSREEKAGRNNKNALAVIREFANIFDEETKKVIFSPEAEEHFFKLIEAKRFSLAQNFKTKDTERQSKIATISSQTKREEYSILQEIKSKNLLSEGQPLRLHLGCGENHFDGYINIDYPPSEHTVQMKGAADIFADITTLNFPEESVDEIRLHHVFEHFNRITALAMLIRWHQWLKIGGKLWIETPDLIGSAKTLLSNASWSVKMGVVRHIAGSHEALWAYHIDQWFPERFEHTLKKLGFDPVQTRTESWQREPYLANCHAFAWKAHKLSLDILLQAAEELLRESTVSAAEKPLHNLWCVQLHEMVQQGISVKYFEPPSPPLQSAEEKQLSEELQTNFRDMPAQSISCLVLLFSKNRSLQLDATLRSFMLHCKDAVSSQIRVLYTATAPLHINLYGELEKEYQKYSFIQFVSEKDFRTDVLALIAPFDYVLFLVDDNIFVRDFTLKEIIESLRGNADAVGFSLRLGRNTSYCYPLDTDQQLPEFQPINRSILKYSWTIAAYDFGYPLEVSSSVYRTEDILPFIASFTFENPNTLELFMNDHKIAFENDKPLLLCFEQSVTFCAPLNIVQTLCTNRSCVNMEYTQESLAKLFDEGYRIDIGAYDQFTPNACHQEIELKFIEPGKTQRTRQPVVSVIIPCYNQAVYLPDAVESVIRQTYQNWECIIVNDGSPDNINEVARSFIAKYPDKDIILLEKENGGVADARNYGIKHAKGKYILPLDADDKIHPAMLEKTVFVLDSDSDIAIAYTDAVSFGKLHQQAYVGEWNLQKLCNQNTLCYCALYRREVWEAVGGYNTNMIYGYEDWDFWVGACEKGYHAKLIPERLFIYRVQESSRSTTAVQYDAELRARIILNHPEAYDEMKKTWAETVLQKTGAVTESSDTLLSKSTDQEHIVPLSELNNFLNRTDVPESLRSLVKQADDSFLKGDLVAARKHILKVLEAMPHDPKFIIAHGNILLRLRANEPALIQFMKAKILDPNYTMNTLGTDALLLLAESYAKEGYKEDAMLLYKKIQETITGTETSH